MSEEFVSHIFEPFEREKSSTASKIHNIQIKIFGMNVCLQNTAQPVKDIRQTAGFLIQMHFTALNAAHIQNIINPFEREKSSTASKIQGTGLGMAITKNIVDMMNGTIEVKSEQGSGTEVLFPASHMQSEE